MTLTQGHGIDKQKIACLQNKVTTTPITTIHGRYIHLVLLITWLDFGDFLLEIYLAIFLKISDVIFQGQTLYWSYPRNGWSDWCETKKRCISWILCELYDLDHDLFHCLDVGFFKVKFQNSCISDIVVWLIWNEKKANKLDTGMTVWSCPLTITMILTLTFQCQSLW